MSVTFKRYKRIFRKNLQPLLAVLAFKRREMDHGTWENYVVKTIESILKNPHEYLGEDLPSSSLMRSIIEEIHMEFVKEMNKIEASEAGIAEPAARNDFLPSDILHNRYHETSVSSAIHFWHKYSRNTN